MSKPKRKLRAEEFRKIPDSDTGKPLDVYTHCGREFPAPSGMPTKLVILGRHYQIRYHTRIFFARKESERLNGIVFYPNRLIIVDPDRTIHQLKQTLYHEVSHVYLNELMTKYQAAAELTSDQVEQICDAFGEAFYDRDLNGQSCGP